MNDDCKRNARRLFNDFLEQNDKEGGSGEDFASFCRRHPTVAAELETLHSTYLTSVTTVLSDSLSDFLIERTPDPGDVVDGVDRSGLVIREEIARGGMGQVSRAFDPDLKREVALKGLLSKHKGNSTYLQRFVEEAQIAGQLEHPGILPVHRFGVGEDGSPYFVMKLIQGRTLQELLKERKAPGDDLPRFLGIFEQICQAIAYSHSRSVIHRDLKPANIMVGAFGEVLVADWGLAKVLSNQTSPENQLEDSVAGEPKDAATKGKGSFSASTHDSAEVKTSRDGDSESGETRAGTVVGTPRYMSPEQGNGGVLESVDERSDVFSLGSILCEIITGAPAYDGTSLNEILEQTMKGELGNTLERIDSTPVEETLRRLAQRCLNPSKSRRPRNAGEVATELRSFFETREERARQAELEAVAAVARADEERQRAIAEKRARRMTMALASTILAVIVIGGAIFWHFDQKKQSRVRTAELAVHQSLADGAGVLARAMESAPSDVAGWQVAEQASLGTLALLNDDIGEDLRRRAEEQNVACARGLAKAKDAARLADLNKMVLNQLTRIREGVIEQGYQRTWSETARDADVSYASAFGKLGIDLSEQTESEILQKMRSSDIKNELIGFLDSWTGIMLAARRGPVAEQREVDTRIKKLLRILIEVDPRPLPKDIRTAVFEEDSGALLEHADNLMPGTPPETIALLANGLRGFHSDGKARKAEASVLALGTQWHPDDFWLALRYSGILLSRGDVGDRRTNRDFQEGGTYTRIARALRPDSVVARRRTGFYFYRIEDVDNAEFALRSALELEPDDHLARSNLGMTLASKRDIEGAVKELRRALKGSQDDPDSYARIGHVLRKGGDHVGSMEAFKRALQVNPDHAMTHIRMAELFMDQEEWHAALQSIRRAREIDTDVSGGRGNEAYCLIQLEQLDAAETVLRESLEKSPGHLNAALSLTAVLQMKGDDAGLVKLLPQILRMSPGSAELWSQLGLSLIRVGEAGQSTYAFLQALAIDRNELEDFLSYYRDGAGKDAGRKLEWNRLREVLAARPELRDLLR